MKIKFISNKFLANFNSSLYTKKLVWKSDGKFVGKEADPSKEGKYTTFYTSPEKWNIEETDMMLINGKKVYLATKKHDYDQKTQMD